MSNSAFQNSLNTYPVTPALGGTGVNNGTSTITLGGALTTSGAFSTTLTVTAATNVTLPTSGTLYGTATGSITSAQLATSLSDETGTGKAVFATSPTFTTSIIVSGTSTGSTTIQAGATAFGTLTLPSATDTLVGKTTTDILTNKTYDTAGSGNSLKINGTQITGISPTSPTVAGSSNGTWIPACTAGTITVNAATYERDGNFVVVNFDIVMPTSATATQGIVTGLPFASADAYTNGALGFTDASIVSIQAGASVSTSTSMSFRTSLSGAFATFAQLTGHRIIGTLTYRI